MIRNRTYAKMNVVCVALLLLCLFSFTGNSIAQLKLTEDAKPLVLWYWMSGNVSKEGITADLEAMKEQGIGGAFIVCIYGASATPLINPPAEQLTPLWWEMILHALKEGDRLGLKLSMHVSDGFALAGGPWIKPEQSMQKVVWTEAYAEGGKEINITLAQPEAKENYYKDIAVFAFPSVHGTGISTRTITPKITTSKPESKAEFLITADSKEAFRSDDPCWIQYEFDAPFTCRSVLIRTNGNNFQSHRLIIEVSDDGKTFRKHTRLEPPRHGWQDTDAAVTHVINPVTAKFFRFLYNKEGSEPGAEDVDAAKWKPSLKISGIELSSEPRLNQYEGKTGEVWRVSTGTNSVQVPDDLCVKKESIVDVTKYMTADGHLAWNAPAGKWTILRMGHTSTGHVNATGGGGKGLECDKFNPETVLLQFDNWFGEAMKKAGPELTARQLKTVYIDSWECGSQNWSPVFRDEFKKRRGYDLYTYLPVMAGIPVQSANISERFLHDVRQTIAELVHDSFYGTLAKLARERECIVSAESVAPTMTSDGMLHYDLVDVPMSEFWLRSPTHDKPNDMADAISGAHIYGKNIIQAEAFTELRFAWDEHPGMLKALGDRNYALGINRFAYHVFVHNPFLNRRPGITLSAIGLFFQRDQTWWKPGKAWVEYAQRCQTLLQQGKPVSDMAVFTGEEIPRRSVLPYRLVPSLPGIFGKDVVASEKSRLANEGGPLRQLPDGVTHTANMADPENWIDPLKGYAYDSFNRDALLRLAQVNNERIELPGGASYGLLVIPKAHPMSPAGKLMTPEVASRLVELVKAGATLIINDRPELSPSLEKFPACDQELKKSVRELFEGKFSEVNGAGKVKQLGKGKVVLGPYTGDSFQALGIERDVVIMDSLGTNTSGIAWTHRSSEEQEIYFVSNQQNKARELKISLRSNGQPELYNPVIDRTIVASDWKTVNGRTELPIKLYANESVFILIKKSAAKGNNSGKNWEESSVTQKVEGPWNVTFEKQSGGYGVPTRFEKLTDWTVHSEPSVRYYSGTATYSTTITIDASNVNKNSKPLWLDLGEVANIAEVKLNGISCGVIWTAPYRVNITNAVKPGANELTILVTNTWANRLIGDRLLSENNQLTWTNAPYRLEGKSLLKGGLLGPVTILTGN